MTLSCLVVSQEPDLAETHLFIGLKRQGWRVSIVCSPAAVQRPRLEAAGIEVFPVVLRGRFDWRGGHFIRQVIHQSNAQIVYAFSNDSVSNAIRAVKGTHACLIVYRGIEKNVSWFDPFSWTTYLHPRVEKIVCVAEAIRDYFLHLSAFGITFSVTKAITIHKGHEPHWYTQLPIARSEFDIPDDAFLVGCTFIYRPRKGIENLIEAMSLLDVSKPIYLLLIGHLPRRELWQQIEQSPFKDRIKVAGHRADAPALMGDCDMCVLPSLRREGLPRAIIEGMIQGVAPVVTDSGGSPELIEQGESGLIIRSGSVKDIAEAINLLYEDRKLLARLKQNAKTRIVQHFNSEKTITQHHELFMSLLASKTPKPN